MEKFITNIFESMTLECGLVVGLLCVSNVFVAWLWWLERKDRRAAYKFANGMLERTIESEKKTTEAIQEVDKTLTVIKDRTRR